jgi:hypothetical protein
MNQKPRPEDYPDKINAYTRAMMRWKAMQPPRPLEPIPADLEHLFTPESLARAKTEPKTLFTLDSLAHVKTELNSLPPIEKETSQDIFENFSGPSGIVGNHTTNSGHQWVCGDQWALTGEIPEGQNIEFYVNQQEITAHMLPTLGEFLLWQYPSNSYIKHPDFRSLYIRKNPITLWVDDNTFRCDDVITIGNIEAKKPGTGALKRLVSGLVSMGKAIYIENVHEPWLQEKLLERGFIRVSENTGHHYLFNHVGHLTLIKSHDSVGSGV